MVIPEYNKNFLYNPQKDGEFFYSDFAEFIFQLLDRCLYVDDVEKGILSFINDNGTENISSKQKYRLEIIIKRFDNNQCKICGENISLIEALDLDENDGLCSYHKYIMDKED